MHGTRLAVVAVVLGVLSVPAAPAHSTEAAATPSSVTSSITGSITTSADDDSAGRRVLADDAIRPQSRAGLAARIRKWPGKRIPYYESIPAKWDWSLDQAFDHWNGAGGKIKFVEVPRRKAKLIIGYGDTGGADGVGTLGYQYRNYVNLSPSYKKANEFNPETRVWVGRLFTHELGHVLGYNHTPGQCSLMYPVYNFGVCETLSYDKPGYYNCRWIDKKLLKRFTQMYGGKPKRPPATCPIEALPGQLTGVTFSGGNAQASRVKITWVPPSSVRAGTKVFVTVWKGGACTVYPNTFERRVAVDPKARSWTDPAFGQGTWCYSVHIENRYGATRPLFGKALARFAPVPAAPALAPTWHGAHGGWHVSWSAPWPGARLEVMRNQDQPEVCVTTYDEWEADSLEEHGAGTWLLDARAPEECVTFFVVTDWGTISPAAQRTLQVAAGGTPAAPSVGPRTWDAAGSQFTFSWTNRPDDFTSLRAMRAPYDDPTECRTGYDEDEADYVYQDYDTGKWQLYANHATECVVFYAVTDWGTRSATGTQVVLEVPAPTATPVVGNIAPWSEDPVYAASAPVTLSSSSASIAIEVLDGACPGTVPNDLYWQDGYEDGQHPGVYYFYAESYGTTQCALFTARDGYGQHGPVVKKTFTVAGP